MLVVQGPPGAAPCAGWRPYRMVPPMDAQQQLRVVREQALDLVRQGSAERAGGHRAAAEPWLARGAASDFRERPLNQAPRDSPGAGVFEAVGLAIEIQCQAARIIQDCGRDQDRVL